jgi:NADP-dependent 3-hydroxy acid dehydrogenase YdfG
VAKLTDEVALVTGASGGIGGAIAAALATSGARVCLAGRDRVRLDALQNRLRANSSLVEVHPLDLTDDRQISEVADRIIGAHKRLDILVHSAGAIVHGKMADVPVETLDLLYAANVRGPYLLTQKLLPVLKRCRGQIVFVNSSAGLAVPPNTGQFSATQHALKALADAFRDEVNAEQVRVLSIFPGRTATPRIEALHTAEGRAYRPELLLQPEDVANVVVNSLALPRTAEVTNISIRPMQKSY